ncbi:MAG: hypothetical protein H6719_17195 [Sandaracinaceae bacterium]|nr:hypothetical protein [Sandaracinaceae bacterium]
MKGPRILAMRANPPEALFGEDVHFEALVVDATGEDLTSQPGVTVRWTVCLSLGQILEAAGLGGNSGFTDGCSPEETLVLEEDGAPNRAVLPGEVLMAVIAMIPMTPPDEPIPDPGIPGVDPGILSSLATVIAEVGVPLAARVDVSRDGEVLLSGYKRFAITTRSGATLNPPPPRFSIGDLELSARGGGDPHACVSADGSIASAAVGEEVTLAPYALEEPWLEDYPVFDLGGEIIINSETAYYSWFSTGGAFSTEISQRPLRDSSWVAPDVAGTYPIFLVVRDGHLGLSWCRADVEVRAN